MKTHLKNVVIAVVAVGFIALSSCSHNTCPTYSKNVAKTEKVNS